MTQTATPPRPARRFGLRFSLRAFLGGVTLFCILLAWQLHRAKMQSQAVAGIRAAGGWVAYDYEYPDGLASGPDPLARPWEPKWLLDLVGIDFFHDVADVNMVFHGDGNQRQDNVQPAVDISPHLAHFPRLRQLLVGGAFIDDEGMAVVGRLKRLEKFYQWQGEHITDAGVAHLRDMPRLDYIHLGQSQVGDRGLATLAKLPNLEGLTMQVNRVTDAGLAHLAGHPKLTDLWIGGLETGPSAITDAGVVHLAKIPNLRALDLQHTQVTPPGLAPLTKLPSLRCLMLTGSTADNFEVVAPMFPGCSVDAKRNPPPPSPPDSLPGS